MAETADEPVEPINQKICVLKASIHCEACKRKVKKILSQIQGVEFVDVDTKQQKVTVTGNVEADTLIKKLAKSGKKAELWPQKAEKSEKVPGCGKKKEKEIETEREVTDPAEAKPCSDNVKAPEPSKKVGVESKNSEEGVRPVIAGDGGSAETSDKTGAGAGGAAAKSINVTPVKTSGDVQEAKVEEKKRDANCSVAKEPVKTAEKKEVVEKSNGGGGGGGGESGTSGKKKKKKGQSGNVAIPSAAAPPAKRESENQVPGPPPGTNHSPPRSHYYPPPNSYYAPAPQPVYAVNYNTAHPTSSSYTTSYYAAPPPYSHVYMHPGPVIEPPPSDLDLNPRQPLDSFEMFSDENPNGCFIM